MIPLIEETYPEPTDSAVRTGGLVKLVRTLWNGDVTEEWLLPLNAISEQLFGSVNGSEVRSSHISLGEVSLGTSDISGSGMCVEWSSIRHLGNNFGYDLG